MIRKWITATRKRQGRAALLDNEIANEWEEMPVTPQDMEARAWAQWRKRAHQGLKKTRGTMHKRQQVRRRMAMKENIAKRHKQAVSNRDLGKYCWTGHNSSSGFFDLAPSVLHLQLVLRPHFLVHFV
jgi:hypothetical protein